MSLSFTAADVVLTGPGMTPEKIRLAYESASSAGMHHHRTGSIRLPHVLPEYVPGLRACAGEGVDCLAVPTGFSTKDVRLMAFDMDCTLVQNECIDEMAAVFGKAAEVAAVTRQAMEGNLPFDESLRRRTALLAGMTRSHVTQAVSRMRLTPGAQETADFCREHGIDLWILSGGFTEFAEPLARSLGAAGFACNQFVWKDDRLTGEVIPAEGRGYLINAEGKAQKVRELCEAKGLCLQQTLCAGDGANDVKMVEQAGVGIAFHAKPVLQAVAQYRIDASDLSAVPLFFLDSWR